MCYNKGEHHDFSKRSHQKTGRRKQEVSHAEYRQRGYLSCGPFTIRLAGNVIDDHQLGSIEYAVEHLGSNLVVVMGHTCCGAVDSAIHHDPSGFIKCITDEIRQAIGDETDPYRASCLNVERSVRKISHALDIDHLRKGNDPAVIGAIYHIDDGHVEFLDM